MKPHEASNPHEPPGSQPSNSPPSLGFDSSETETPLYPPYNAMSPAPDSGPPAPAYRNVGPHPSFIEVARSYIFQHQIDQALAAINTSENREMATRLQGVAHIDMVRRSLNL
jgi:hypothetical protein